MAVDNEQPPGAVNPTVEAAPEQVGSEGPTAEEDRIPGLLYDRNGYPVTGKLTKDRVIVWAGVAVLAVLFCSWTAQWVAFALPYWRADKYHNGGLFQICGTQDLAYDPNVDDLVANTSLASFHPYRCQTVKEYADDLTLWACNREYFVPLKNTTKPLERRGKGGGAFTSGPSGPFDSTDNDFCAASKLVANQIFASRLFEAGTTCLDMIFGVTTVAFMLFPDKHEKKSTRNGMLALVGIILTPWMCVIDLFIQNGYWDRIGVGLFNKDARGFLSGAAQTTIATSTIDLFIQFGFLQWATHRHGWKLAKFKIGDVGMGVQRKIKKNTT
ncbi:hypothetical protein BC830DRAFT_324756 [Chytriomyces sp. MP71]|nr:hypothetical protein BC830DRAFT_324756 [Chytriomyces sp. MP71]